MNMHVARVYIWNETQNVMTFEISAEHDLLALNLPKLLTQVLWINCICHGVYYEVGRSRL
jgi:hypothetical protein